MHKFLCSLVCTWMRIIDSQFYIIDSLSLDVSLEWNANLVVAKVNPSVQWVQVPRGWFSTLWFMLVNTGENKQKKTLKV